MSPPKQLGGLLNPISAVEEPVCTLTASPPERALDSIIEVRSLRRSFAESPKTQPQSCKLKPAPASRFPITVEIWGSQKNSETSNGNRQGRPDSPPDRSSLSRDVTRRFKARRDRQGCRRKPRFSSLTCVSSVPTEIRELNIRTMI